MTFNLPISRRGGQLVALGLAGLLGAAVAGVDLFQATRTVRSLYTGGIMGLSVFADLASAIQDSRRQFLYALASADPNRQLPYIDKARAADQDVARVVTDLGRLELGESVARSRLRLEVDWANYLTVRDEAMALILEGRPEDAVSLVTEQGDVKFEAVSGEMARIKRQLDSHGSAQTRAVRLTFFRAGLELLFLFICTFLVIAALVRALATLHRNNQIIARARESEQVRFVQKPDVRSTKHEAQYLCGSCLFRAWQRHSTRGPRDSMW